MLASNRVVTSVRTARRLLRQRCAQFSESTANSGQLDEELRPRLLRECQTLPQSEFIEFGKMIRDTPREERGRKIAEVFTELKQAIPRITDRQIYKLLFPLAEHNCVKQLHPLMIQSIVEPLKHDNYKLLTQSNINTVAYLKNYGRGFFLPGKN